MSNDKKCKRCESYKAAYDAILNDLRIMEQKLNCLTSERDQLKEENGKMDSMYQDRLLDMEAKVNKAVSECDRIKAENERLRNELKLCNRSRKWWKSLAYEANAEKISCRAATIKQNEEAALRREVDGGKDKTVNSDDR